MGIFGESRVEALARRRLRIETDAAEAARLSAVKRPHLADRPYTLSPVNAVTHVDDWRVVCDPPRTKVLIYGAGYGRDEAPLDDPSWCVWALNLVAPYDRNRLLRADAWWEIHQRKAQTADDLRWIAACPVPIYLPPDLMDASQRAVRYPLADVEARFGAYFSCTFAYQIALILLEEVVTDVGLYGVELAYGSERERTVEWACTSYWLGRLEERGIRIHLPQHSRLGRHEFRYGFEYQEEIDEVNRYTYIMRRPSDG